VFSEAADDAGKGREVCLASKWSSYFWGKSHKFLW